MRRTIATILIVGVVLGGGVALAHFQVILPSDDIVGTNEPRELTLRLVFTHPMEGGPAMQMERPQRFGVFVGGKRQSLLGELRKVSVPVFAPWHSEFAEHRNERVSAWEGRYRLRRPGDHQFYVVPQPYFEPSEGVFIWQMAKVVVNAFGMEAGWDRPIGLRAEIVPLTRPYGIWAGNVFRGLVLMDGKPAPGLEVEVEYYNADGRARPPSDPFVTQVVKTDAQGVFAYAIPWPGWWGFSALGEGGTMKHGGKDVPVELDAVIWVRAHGLPPALGRR